MKSDFDTAARKRAVNLTLNVDVASGVPYDERGSG